MSFSKESIVTLAIRQREEYAEEIFSFKRVADAIRQAALDGKSDLRISQEKQITLKHTKAASSLISRLEKLKFDHTWQQTPFKERTIDGQETGSIIVYLELVIYWGFVDRRGATPDVSPD